MPTLPPLRASWRNAVASLALTALAAGHTAWATPNTPAGRWIAPSGNVEVEMAPCGSAWCGTITRVLGQQSMSRPGEVMTPVDNRPALGMTILKDFTVEEPDSGDGPRWSGHIYNRENGKTYRCLMSLDASSNLILRPYVGLPLFGKTQVWKPSEATTTEARP